VAELGGVHAAFWAGAAVSAAALAASAAVLPPSAAAPRRPLDVVGALLLGAGVTGLLVALGRAGTWGWTSPLLLATAGGAVVALGVWVLWEVRTPHPLVDVRLARGRVAFSAHSAALLVGLSNYLLLTAVPVLAQAPASPDAGLGASIVVAGLVLLPFSVSSVFASRLAARLDRWAGPRAVLPVGALVLGVGLLLFGLVRDELWQLFVGTAVSGIGVGMLFAALPGLIVGAVPAGETGSAMSLNQVLRYIGFAIGSALSATLLEAATPDGAGQPASGGYVAIAVVGCAACLAVAGLTALLPTARSTRQRAGAPAR